MYGRDLVIFGFDGVLVDFADVRTRAWAAALADAGITLDDGRLRARLEGVSPAVFVRSIEAEFGVDLPGGFANDLDRRLRALSIGGLEPVGEVAGAVRRLRGTLALVALESEAVVRQALEQVGLWRRFAAHVFTADQVAQVPPAPDLYQFAAAQLGVPAGRCVVVEATAHGVRGGKAAGMAVFGFAGTGHGQPETQAALLRAAGADLVFDRMRELPPLVGARAA